MLRGVFFAFYTERASSRPVPRVLMPRKLFRETLYLWQHRRITRAPLVFDLLSSTICQTLSRVARPKQSDV